MENEYIHDIEIDRTALDLEWLRQPSLMFKYVRLQADANVIFNRAKENLELVKAELDEIIRNNPAKYNITKVINNAVTAAILQHPKYQKALTTMNAALYDLNIYRAAVDALAHKKSALENLVKLHGQNYFAGPSVPNAIDRQWERDERNGIQEKEANGKVRFRTRNTN